MTENDLRIFLKSSNTHVCEEEEEEEDGNGGRISFVANK